MRPASDFDMAPLSLAFEFDGIFVGNWQRWFGFKASELCMIFHRVPWDKHALHILLEQVIVGYTICSPLPSNVFRATLRFIGPSLSWLLLGTIQNADYQCMPEAMLLRR